MRQRPVEPVANDMSSFYAQSEWEFKKNSVSIIIAIHLLPSAQGLSSDAVWLSGKSSRVKLEGQGCY